MTAEAMQVAQSTEPHEGEVPLPWSSYVSDSVYERDRQILEHSWHYVGPAAWIREEGQFVTVQVGRRPIIVVRTAGGVKAYPNVCRHRGATFSTELCGKAPALRCPYHAWTWNLDGTLRVARDFSDLGGTCKADWSLMELPVVVWGPTVFVGADVNVCSFEELIGDLGRTVDAFVPDLDELQFHERMEYQIPCNWKLFVENFSECYHCIPAHPSFSEAVDTGAGYKVTIGGTYHSLHNAPFRDDSGEATFAAYLWPAFGLAAKNGRPWYLALAIRATSAETTEVAIDFYHHPETTQAQRDELREFNDVVMQEDMVLCRIAQAGTRSGFYSAGTLVRGQEIALAHFHNLVRSAWAAHLAASSAAINHEVNE